MISAREHEPCRPADVSARQPTRLPLIQNSSKLSKKVNWGWMLPKSKQRLVVERSSLTPPCAGRHLTRCQQGANKDARTSRSAQPSQGRCISYAPPGRPWSGSSPEKSPDSISEFDQKLFLKHIKTEEYYRLANSELTLAHRISKFAKELIKKAEELTINIKAHLKE